MLPPALQNNKSTVQNYFPDSQVLLFGSRARREGTNDSDYDIMIITQQSFSPREKFPVAAK